MKNKKNMQNLLILLLIGVEPRKKREKVLKAFAKEIYENKEMFSALEEEHQNYIKQLLY